MFFWLWAVRFLGILTSGFLRFIGGRNFSVCHSPVDFRAHSRAYPHSLSLTPAHSRSLPLTPAHSRSLSCLSELTPAHSCSLPGLSAPICASPCLFAPICTYSGLIAPIHAYRHTLQLTPPHFHTCWCMNIYRRMTEAKTSVIRKYISLVCNT